MFHNSPNVHHLPVVNDEDDKLAKETEKQKLIEVIYSFDKFIKLLFIIHSKFCNIKTKINAIGLTSKEHFKECEYLDERIKLIENRQKQIEIKLIKKGVQ